MQLYGSTTSPYARRLRIFMQDLPHDFIQVDVFNSLDRANLIKDNPSLKIPVLKDQGQIVLDSRMIYQYLNQKLNLKSLSWDQENTLSCIDSANESLVQLLILSRSEIDISADKLFFRIQRERLDVIFAYLENEAKLKAFEDWNYLSISLYCLLDWLKFRNLYDVTKYTCLTELYERWHPLAICHATDPRS